MSQIMYNLTFVVTEDSGIVSNGTRISLNSGEQEGLTNNGQVIFKFQEICTIGLQVNSILKIK